MQIIYNQKQYTSKLVFSLNKIDENGVYNVNITLRNFENCTYQYPIKVNITGSKKNKTIVSAEIKRITQLGVVTLQFNESMTLNKSIPWINYQDPNMTIFNTSWINYTNTNIKIPPAKNRNQDLDFNQSQINLSWNVTAITYNQIIF